MLAPSAARTGNECSQPEHRREGAVAPRDEHEARERDEWRQPAEENERLEAMPRVTRDEVEQLGRVALDVGERSP